MCDREWDDFNRRVIEAIDEAGDPVERVRMAGRAYVRWGRENPEQYRILFMSRPAPAEGEGHEGPQEGPPPTSSFWRLVESAGEAMEAGQIVRADPYFVAVGLWSAVHGVTSLVVANPAFPWPDIDELAEHVIDTHLRGLAPTPPAPPGSPGRSARPRPRPGARGRASPV